MEQRRLELVFAEEETGSMPQHWQLLRQECGQMPGERHPAEKTAWDQCGGLDCSASSQPRELQI